VSLTIHWGGRSSPPRRIALDGGESPVPPPFSPAFTVHILNCPFPFFTRCGRTFPRASPSVEHLLRVFSSQTTFDYRHLAINPLFNALPFLVTGMEAIPISSSPNWTITCVLSPAMPWHFDSHVFSCPPPAIYLAYGIFRALWRKFPGRFAWIPAQRSIPFLYLSFLTRFPSRSLHASAIPECFGFLRFDLEPAGTSLLCVGCPLFFMVGIVLFLCHVRDGDTLLIPALLTWSKTRQPLNSKLSLSPAREETLPHFLSLGVQLAE